MPISEENNQKSLYTIIKGRFKAIDTNTFGLILIFMNNNLKLSENISIVASHFSSMYETDPKGPWTDIEERILGLKWRGEYATSISRDMQNFFESSLKGDLSDELHNLLKSNAVSKIEHILLTLLMKPLGDKNIHIELSWENVTSEEIQIAKDARENKDIESSEDQSEPQIQQETTSSEFNLEEGSVLLDVDLILAPVSGIPIFELSTGDQIMVKINPSTNRGRYFIDLLNAQYENEIIPIPSTVTEIKINKYNEYAILLKIGEGIFGKTTETEQVKLKRYDPSNEKKNSPQANMKNLASAGFGNNANLTTKEDKAITNLYWLMYLGGFIIVIALLFIILNII